MSYDVLVGISVALMMVGGLIVAAAVTIIMRFRVDQRNRDEAKKALLRLQGEIDATNRLRTSKFGFFFKPEVQLQKLGVNMAHGTWILIRLSLCLGCAFIFAFMLNNPFVGLLGIAIGLLIPKFIIRFLVKRRETKFTKQLSQALPLIAENMRAGLTIEGAITSVTRFMQDPFRSEFSLVCQEFAMTNDIAGALMSCAERLQNNDLEQLANIVGIVRDSGGNIAELLDVEANHLEKRIAMRNHIKAITSQGRMQGALLAGLPFVLLLIMCMGVEDPYRNFWMSGSTVSLILLGVMIVMDGIGLYVMSRMYNLPIN